jgi:2-phospho-L-lactate guanylyltransferase
MRTGGQPRQSGLDLLVPVKGLADGKSRLFPTAKSCCGTTRRRADLVLSIALDTVRAALEAEGVRRVVVVTPDATVAAHIEALGAFVELEKDRAGLNVALRRAAHRIELRQRTCVGAILGDLPALRPAELSAAVEAANGLRAFCPDRRGTGTTLLLGGVGRRLDPRFGDLSAAAHGATGALRLHGPWPSLRGDVDTVDDLKEVTRLGLGGRTSVELSRHEPQCPLRRHVSQFESEPDSWSP